MKSYQSNLSEKDSSYLLQKFLLSLFVVSVFLFGSTAKGVSAVYAQADKKIIKLSFSMNPQLKFTDVKVGEKTRKLNESFDAESDWVRNLSFNLENISGKSIVFMTVNVNFPETRATGNMLSYQVTFGQRPGSTHKISQPNKQLLLKSNEILEVSLNKEKDKLDKFVTSRQPFELIHTIELEIGFIVFEDKSAWSAGAFMRQDSNNPDVYIPVEN